VKGEEHPILPDPDEAVVALDHCPLQPLEGSIVLAQRNPRKPTLAASPKASRDGRHR